jgi:predicted amidohydrolase
MSRVRIALAQMNPALGNKAANLAAAEGTISVAAARGAEIVLFPELFLTGYFTRGQTRALAEPAGGASIAALAQCARTHHVAVVMGFPELDPPRDAVYDSVGLIAADGRVMGCYRKTHLYGEEGRYFAPGDRYDVVGFGACLAGPMICFDVEFPEVARILALHGAQVLLVSSANMTPFQPHQEIYLRARAVENHAFVALVNRVGMEERVEFFGGSGVSDPMGRLLCQARNTEELLLVDLDLSLIDQAREPLDYFSNRRPGLYGPLVAAPSDPGVAPPGRDRGERRAS